MAVTPNYSIPYPALTDSPNGPSQIQAAVSVIDTVIKAQLPTSGLTPVWQNGVSNITITTSKTGLIAVAVPDPGFSYRLKVSGQIDWNSYGTFTAGAPPYCLGFITLDTVGGAIQAQTNGFAQSASGSFDAWTLLPEKTIGPFTGTHTIYLVGQGSVAVLCGYGSFTTNATWLDVCLAPS